MNNTTSAFAINTLQSIYSAYNNNLSYSSTEYIDSKGDKQIVALLSYLGNPNYSGINVPPGFSESIYNGLISSLNQFITHVQNNNVPNYNLGNITNFRILVTIADGNVFFDSSKGNKNTYQNFLNQSISENHGTRHYIQQSFHSKDGIGYESKWSSTTQGIDTYYSQRLGMAETGIIGVIVFSYSNVY